MTTESWLQPHLEAVLRNGLEVLRKWRKQANLQGRIKNLENWVLVELNHELVSSGFARAVLTNGFFEDDLSLFDYLEGGETLDEFLRQFPSVHREQALAALQLAKEGVLISARPA